MKVHHSENSVVISEMTGKLTIAVRRTPMPDLNSANLEALNLEDVKNFLCLDLPPEKRPPEGPQLDYKEAFIPDLGETVAAFANTYGGHIIIGVAVDKKNKAVPTAAPGADLGPDARARITDRIVSSVYPRPDFGVRALPIADQGKQLAVVRVREGAYPPYQYSQGATIKIPVRVQDTSRQASVREVEVSLGSGDASIRNRRK